MSFTIKRAFLRKERKSEISDSDNWATLLKANNNGIRNDTKMCCCQKLQARREQLNESKRKSCFLRNWCYIDGEVKHQNLVTKKGQIKLPSQDWHFERSFFVRAMSYGSIFSQIGKSVTISRFSIYPSSFNWSLDKLTWNWSKTKRERRLAEQLCESYIIRSNHFMNIHVANCHVIVAILTH